MGAYKDDRVTVLRSNRILAIGEWHKIRFSQSGRRLSLWVEGSAVSTTTDYNGLYMRRGQRIYFGGLPDLSKLPLPAISGFPVPYRGCIRQLMVSGMRVMLNETNIRGEGRARRRFICRGMILIEMILCRVTQHPGLRRHLVRRRLVRHGRPLLVG